MELDKNQEKLRQKEGWFHWVVQGRTGELSVGSPVSPFSPSMVAATGSSGSASVAPSDTSDVAGVSEGPYMGGVAVFGVDEVEVCANAPQPEGSDEPPWSVFLTCQ